MPKAIQVVSGFVTAPGATLTSWTMGAGDSLTTQNATPGSKALLLQHWAFNQVAGVMVVRSPKMHDNVQCLRDRIIVNDVEPLEAVGNGTRMYPVDTLVVQQSGSAVGGQIESGSLLIYYDDLPGITARFIGVAELMKRTIDLMYTEVAITPAAAGGYSGATAINATFDNFQAGFDYALLGGVVDARCCTVSVRGADTGNLRVGFPGEPSKRDVTEQWFYWLSSFYQLPLIPIFAANNKAAITVDVVQNQAAAAVNVNFLLARLAPA